MNAIMQKVLMSILPMVVTQLTPAIRDEIKKSLDTLEQKAATTPNPFDDAAVKILRAIVGL